jgi:hypothetical protein
MRPRLIQPGMRLGSAPLDRGRCRSPCPKASGRHGGRLCHSNDAPPVKAGPARPLASFNTRVTVDGAVRSILLRLIKGGGGACRAKVCALRAHDRDFRPRQRVIASLSFPSRSCPLALARRSPRSRLPLPAPAAPASSPCGSAMRLFFTDNGNVIADCAFGRNTIPNRSPPRSPPFRALLSTGCFSGAALASCHAFRHRNAAALADRLRL